MRRLEILTALILALFIGAGILLVFNEEPRQVAGAQAALPAERESPVVQRTLTASDISLQATPTPTPAQPLIMEGKPASEDIEDLVVLYSSRGTSSFAKNAVLLASFYGVSSQEIAYDPQAFRPEDLVDSRGENFQLIVIDASLLRDPPAGMLPDHLDWIREKVGQGSSLLIGKIDEWTGADALQRLTDGQVSGAVRPEDSIQDWVVSEGSPDITRELTGQTVLSPRAANIDTYALSFDPKAWINPLISSRDDRQEEYLLFAHWRPGQFDTGSVYLDSGEMAQPLGDVALREVFYSASSFTQIIPSMMAIRYVLGDETWHRDLDMANLMIDEVQLVEPYLSMNYTAMLELMKRYNFHTSLGFIPASWQQYEPEVIAMILTNPTYYSVVQYGNTGDGYEFYRYESEATGERSEVLLPARPFEMQERAIFEGLARMNLLQNTTRIPLDLIMIFPGGISPEQTLVMLKEQQYLATSNAQELPLDAERPDAFAFGMAPAVTEYGGFPNLVRRSVNPAQNVQPYLFTTILDLFIDKPALLYTYPTGLGMFANGIETVGLVAEDLNRLQGDLRWDSLGNIARNLYLEKTNDDGSRSVRMYTRELVLYNTADEPQQIYLTRPENLNVAIKSVTVNGRPFPYQIDEGVMAINMILPAGERVEIQIAYGQ